MEQTESQYSRYHKEKYHNDPIFRAVVNTANKLYKKTRYANDPDYREYISLKNKEYYIKRKARIANGV